MPRLLLDAETGKIKENLPERHEKDFYQTPHNLIHFAMQTYAPVGARSILDIGAGDGRWGRIAKEYCPKAEVIAGVDIRPLPCPDGFTDWHILDYSFPLLSERVGRRFDFVCGNPPFRFAESFVRNGWRNLLPGGRMVLLLPHEFQAGIARCKGLWQELWPREVAVLARRVPFTGPSNPNVCNLFVWEKGTDGRPRGVRGQWWAVPVDWGNDSTLKESEEK